MLKLATKSNKNGTFKPTLLSSQGLVQASKRPQGYADYLIRDLNDAQRLLVLNDIYP